MSVFAGAASALAHHSVSGVFDTHKQIVLKGVISRVELATSAFLFPFL